MKRFLLIALMAVPVFGITMFLASLVPGFDKVDVKVTGSAWYVLLGSILVSYMGLKAAAHTIFDRFGQSKILAFVCRALGFAFVLPFSFFVASLVYSSSVVITEPLAAFAIAVALGVASATSDELEKRFLPKPKLS